ncbi:MAG: polysaccharide biosynthesis tyrosine autokinase [Planctomycetes bacterium]|nr:polysaccharide biosynthesis tyrosine autokinase [Planctomycetota bacterium]
MSDLAKYHDHLIEQRLADFETLPESDSRSISNMIKGILRRWYIVLLIFFVMCAVGIPAIWLLIEPLYSVTGAIRVDPISQDPITGEVDTGGISYQSYMNSQAEIITSSLVAERVAGDLADKNLAFFKSEPTGFVTKLKQRLKNSKTKPEPASILKQAISNGVISAAFDRRTEFIRITVKSANAEEAKTIADAFISVYTAVENTSSSEDEWQTINLLEGEAKSLAGELKIQRENINAKAKEYGSKSSTTLDKRQEIKLERMGMLLTKITEWEARRIDLEAQVDVLKERFELPDANTQEQATEQQKLAIEVEQGVDPNDPMRREYINADPILNMFIANLARLEQELIVTKQILQPTNQELKNKADVVEALKERIEQHKTEVGKVYDSFIAKKAAEAEKEKLLNTKKQLADIQDEWELASALEKRFKDKFDQEDTETIDVGLRQMDIEELQFQLGLDQQMYDTIRRRIQILEMVQKRPARISVAYPADIASIRDKRIKYTMALMFGSMACGMMLAYLRDKADLRLRKPEDVVKRIGIRIIGTTTSSDTIKKTLFPRQIAGDYQTIRANLRLLNGDRIPKMLVVTSPGTREGKTTFAINLATSMSKSGKKVLLIDGDLRKPDVVRMLNLPRGSRGLQDLLFGRKIDQAVYPVSSIGLDVLVADSRNRDDACELLTLPGSRQRIKTISEKYHHVIIDTPPVLAFPDALLWAKMADAVILTSFAGQTTAPDLREATEKLAQINANVLGTILSNVEVRDGYYRYGHNYYVQNARSWKNSKRDRSKLLLLAESET